MGLKNSKAKEGGVSVNQGSSKSREVGQGEKGWTNEKSNEPSDDLTKTSGPRAEAAAARQELSNASIQQFFQPQTKTTHDLRTDSTQGREEEGRQ